MSIYFDFETINELTGNDYYRQPKEFTLDELEQYNGKNGNLSYVAIEGIVYDVSKQSNWGEGTHFGLSAGQDLSDQFNSCHGMMNILNNAPKVGILKDDDFMYGGLDSAMNGSFRQQDTSKFSPDDWVRYITPIVTYGLREPNQGMSPQRIYQKVAILGVLVGLGRTPQEAISQLQDWQNTGASQLLGGKGTGTTGGPGMGGMGTGTSGGTTTGTTGTSGVGTGGGTGNGGMGTGAGTAGGFGGFGTGTGGVTGNVGMGTGTSGGTGISGTPGTSGGAGTGTGGMGTSGNAGIGSIGRTDSGTRDKLYFD